MRLAAFVALAACSSPSKPASVPPPPPPPPDAAVDAASPDAGIPETAATWTFRYSTAQRTETWSLRFGDGHASIDVESATGTLHYFGTATDAGKIDVATSSAKLSLECKRAKRSLSTKCNDKKAKPVDVLDCYHPDFKEPMPFGEGNGVEYVVDASCNGYRLR